MVNGRNLPLQRPGQAPLFSEGSLEITEGSPRRDPLTGVASPPLLAFVLQRVLPPRSLPETASPPSTGRLLGKLRVGGALKKMLSDEGRVNRDATLGGSRGTSG